MKATTTGFTVSGVDPLFGQRVNCGSYYTLADAIDYVVRNNRSTSREYAHDIHETPLGYSVIDSHLIVWQSLRRLPREK
jgi:hypothetical protein